MGRGGGDGDGDDHLSCSFIGRLSRIFALSPFASKVFRQDCDHSLQRSQHRPVDHHWPVQLAVTAEVRRKMEVIDESIIASKAKAAARHHRERCAFLHIPYD